MGAVEDILLWSQTRCEPWRQDALRRLASQPSLGTIDHDEILNLVKDAVGFPFQVKPNPPIPLEKSHFGTASARSPFHLKAVRNIRNVNRLAPAAHLTFSPLGLTVIYGRNGSGKSGFVRILRTACRTRIDSPAKLKVLADVYGEADGPQEAEIIIEVNGAETPIPWTAGKAASEQLLHVSVFDSSAAQFYVDGGNEIQFLPFGLALPHKLNDLCLTLKARLDGERRAVTQQLALATVSFTPVRPTKAQSFYGSLNGNITDGQIDAACTFSADDQTRLGEVIRLLSTDARTSADVSAAAVYVENLADECEKLVTALSDDIIERCRKARAQALAAREAASLDASALFADEPLEGVGKETWRRLWLAARDYSLEQVYPGKDFPVTTVDAAPASCVLCQQPLQADATERLARFQSFMTGALELAADEAETALSTLVAGVPEWRALWSADWPSKLDQITSRDRELGIDLAEFCSAAEARRNAMKAILDGSGTGGASTTLTPLSNVSSKLTQLAEQLTSEADAITQALGSDERRKLTEERAELEDRKVLSGARERLMKRRDLLTEHDLFAAAESQLTTTGITRKANELVDQHLTEVVFDRFKVECKELEITHLKVALARKSDQTRATFQTNPGTSLTKFASEILSEGEQRALALAAFLTEVTVNDGGGPIVIDDPVSSLDRERGARVAKRIARESLTRQTVVFTHDLIFFNDLCREADEAGAPPEVIALFSDKANAGKIDPSGVIWKGLNVAKRLARIRSDFAAVRKLRATSPSNYEVQLKNLYGRLRDTYERVVEEIIFYDVIRRGSDRIETQKLRFVHLSDALAVRFHEGMTKANTHSHDNPESETVITPEPDEFERDLTFIDALVEDLKAECAAAEGKRPSMKPKK